MPLLIIALILLVAVFGFWDTLGAIVGGAAILILLVVVLGGIAAWGAYSHFSNRSRGSDESRLN